MTIGNFGIKKNYTIYVFLITQVVRKPRLMLIPALSRLGFFFLFSGSGKVEGWGGGGDEEET